MRNKNIMFLAVILIVGCIQFAFVFTSPPPSVMAEIDPSQMGYSGVLQDPVFHLLFCLSLIMMSVGFYFVIPKFLDEKKEVLSNINALIIPFMVGLICIVIAILWTHWTYIHDKFLKFCLMLIAEAYNPMVTKTTNYLQWKYMPTPAKAAISLLLVPLLLPLFYYLKENYKREINQSKRK